MNVPATQSIAGRQASVKTIDLRPFVPVRPRFLHELVVIPFEEEVIIEGTERLQAVKEAGSSSILLDLIALMNGDRTLDELTSGMPGIAEEEVLEAIASLYRFGLIEEGAAYSESEYPNLETLAFLRRYVAVTGANRSGGEAYERLRSSEVLIFDSDHALRDATCLKALLAKTGVGRVVPFQRILPAAWPPPASTPLRQSMAVSLSFSGEDREWHRQLDDWCLEHRLPWLRVVLSQKGNYADFGPLFNPDQTPCYRCFEEVHSITEGSASRLNENEPRAVTHYWTGMAAVEIVYLLSRIGPLATERSLERHDLQGQTSRRLHLLRVPGCLRCCPLLPEQVNGADTDHALGAVDSAVVFEDYISLPARPRIPSSIQEDYAQISSVLVRQAKRMPNCTRFQFPQGLSKLERPALEILDQPTEARREVITVDDLSTVLMATAGVRELGEQKVQRWTATAGNLGSVELFVVVRRVEGLTPGIYFYQSHDHSLAHFQQRRFTSSIPELMQCAAVLDRPDLPDVLVLLTGAYHRLEKKYGEFGYKLVNLDAGVAVSQIHFVARSLGVFPLTASRWADDVIEQQLNLDLRQEQVTAVVALYATADSPSMVTHSADNPIPMIWQAPSAKRPSDFHGLDLRDVSERLYRESRMNEQSLRSALPTCRTVCYRAPFGPSLPLQLPPPQVRGGLTVDDVLAQRTTVRNFAVDPVSPRQLATILDRAHRGDQEQWGEEHLTHPLTFYVLAWNLEGFDPGIYVYDVKNHGLYPHAPARSFQESMNLFVQPEFASAAVIIWIAGDLAACAPFSAVGHRYLLLRAGSAGHRLWTAALAMGLSGGITAGLVSGSAHAQIGLDGYRQTSLAAFATGVRRYLEENDGTAVDAEPK